MSFGYGIHTTPLQMLTFYNAIANNGVMVRPKFVKEVSYQNNNKGAIIYPTEIINPKIASKQTLDKLKYVMKNVVKRGTATTLYSPDYSLAGKTGTSQANYWTTNPSYISSFVGFFPYENPKYSCIVVVHIPMQKVYYGSLVAGPVFQKIAHKIFAATPTINQVKKREVTYKALNRSFNNYKTNQVSKSKLMPNVVGLSGMDAVSLLENMGLNVQFQGNGSVIFQSIVVGTTINKGNTVYLTLS
jgi:cell division protein FtsI (penicillin-binding protein 3)